MAQTQIQGQQLKDLTVATADIADNAVTLAKMAQMSTANFLGRNTAGTGDVESLSVATVKSLLSIAGLTVDATMELDPTGAGSGQFLKYNGSKWIPGDPDASTITMPVVGSPTINTLAEDFTTRGSTGVVDGTLTYVTASGANTVDVAGGEGYLRVSNDQQAALKIITWSASAGITIPAPAAGQETVRFIGVEYNSGTPQVTTRTTFNWNWYTDFPLARVSYDGTTLRILNAYAHAEDTANFARRFNRLILPFQREQAPEGSGGLILSNSGTRNVAMSAGNMWHGFNRYVISAIDTSVSGSFDTHYRRAGGGFNSTTGVTQWPNTQYDDGSGTLVTMTNNKYACLWFYVDASDGSLDMVYGRNQYNNVGDAQAEQPPTTPEHITAHGRLLGRFIFQKSASTPSTTESAWSVIFAGAAIPPHNDLGGLQGGTAGEYYHLTASQYTGLLSGSGASTRVAYWSGASTLTSNSGFTFDGSNLLVPTSYRVTAGIYVTKLESNGITVGDGYDFNFIGGPSVASGNGGSTSLYGGLASGAGNGGSFYLSAGNSIGGGSGGSVFIGAGSGGAGNGTIKLYPPGSGWLGNYISLVVPSPSGSSKTITLPDATGTVALTSDLSGYVPYTGASSDVDLGANNLTAQTIVIPIDSDQISVGSTIVGTLTWTPTTVDKVITLPNATGTVALTHIIDTTDSSSVSTGAFIVDGGIGIAKALWVGGGLNVSHFALTATMILSSSATNTSPVMFKYVHNTSGTAAAAFGLSVGYYLDSNTTPSQAVATDQVVWTTPTHASRKARRSFWIFDTTSREALRLDANGSNAIVTMPDTLDASSTTVGAVVISGGIGVAKAIYGGSIISAATGFRINDAAASNKILVGNGTNFVASANTLNLSGNATLSGTNTGDQTITLTGDVTGSGTGSFATTIAASAVHLSMIGQSFAIAQSSAGLTLTTAYQDVTSCTATFTPAVAETVLVCMHATFNQAGGTAACTAGDNLQAQFVVDGTPQTPVGGGLSTGNIGHLSFVQWFKFTLTAASHTIKVQARNATGNRGLCGTNTHFMYWRIIT